MRKKGEKLKVNQILVTEKLYVTPELKRKKRIYKIELFLSVFLICLLFSYYIYAEYDRNKSEEVSKDILAQIKEQVDDTVKTEDDGKIVVILEVAGAQEEPNNQTETTNKAQTNNATKIDTKTYTSKDGVKYTTEAILKILCAPFVSPTATLSETSFDKAPGIPTEDIVKNSAYT